MKESPLPRTSDGLELTSAANRSARSPTAWLIQAYVKYLNADESDEAAAAGLKHVVELLRDRKDAPRALASESHRAAHDPMLRWNLLHALGALRNRDAAKFLAETAASPLPAVSTKGCHGPLDAEILVRTMAIEALHTTLQAHPERAELMLTLINSNLVPALRAEAVKAAQALGLGDKVKELLPQEDHWMLNLRKAALEELQTEQDLMGASSPERLLRAPSLDTTAERPRTVCCNHPRND